MEDSRIIDLYWQRSEAAIGETEKKYARYCHSISFNILHSKEDAEECVNDTWLNAWNTMPPCQPSCLAAFLGRITRNLSLDRFKRYSAEKRGGGQTELALDELDEAVPGASGVEEAIDGKELSLLVDSFLGELPREKRMIFVKRYWYFLPIKAIAEQMGTSEKQVNSALFRLRKELRKYLEGKGVAL